MAAAEQSKMELENLQISRMFFAASTFSCLTLCLRRIVEKKKQQCAVCALTYILYTSNLHSHMHDNINKILLIKKLTSLDKIWLYQYIILVALNAKKAETGFYAAYTLHYKVVVYNYNIQACNTKNAIVAKELIK